MRKKQNIFSSEYIIDGVHKELTPAQILAECCPDAPAVSAPYPEEPVVDESLDPTPGALDYNPSRIRKYLALTSEAKREFPVFFSGPYTRIKLARSLIGVLWHRGHFRLDDLFLKAVWHWRDSRMGDMAAFYDSVNQAAECLDSLSLKLSSYRSVPAEDGLDVEFIPVIGSSPAWEGIEEESASPKMGVRHVCPETLVPEPASWIVYIPFDTSEFRLGGSLLNQVMGVSGGGRAPELADPDYFEDCFEVVREFVEDGILLAGTGTGDGGLLTTLQKMTGEGVGASVDVSDLLRAYPGSDLVRVLFSEVPGIVIQVRDSDFDYIDAELLLQDIAYFPLGHPTAKSGKVEVRRSSAAGIQNILESLIRK